MRLSEISEFSFSASPLLLDPVRIVGRGWKVRMMWVAHWRGWGRGQGWRPSACVKWGHDGVRNMSDLAPRVPGLPPLPGVVDDLEILAPDDRQLLLVVGRPRVRNLEGQ